MAQRYGYPSPHSGEKLPPTGKGNRQSTEVEPGGPFVPGKPGKPLIPLDPKSPSGPGLPINEDRGKGAKNTQRLMVTTKADMVSLHRQLKPSRHQPPRAFPQGRDVSKQFQRYADTSHGDHSISDLLL